MNQMMKKMMEPTKESAKKMNQMMKPTEKNASVPLKPKYDPKVDLDGMVLPPAIEALMKPMNPRTVPENKKNKKYEKPKQMTEKDRKIARMSKRITFRDTGYKPTSPQFKKPQQSGPASKVSSKQLDTALKKMRQSLEKKKLSPKVIDRTVQSTRSFPHKSVKSMKVRVKSILRDARLPDKTIRDGYKDKLMEKISPTSAKKIEHKVYKLAKGYIKPKHYYKTKMVELIAKKTFKNMKSVFKDIDDEKKKTKTKTKLHLQKIGVTERAIENYMKDINLILKINELDRKRKIILQMKKPQTVTKTVRKSTTKKIRDYLLSKEENPPDGMKPRLKRYAKTVEGELFKISTQYSNGAEYYMKRLELLLTKDTYYDMLEVIHGDIKSGRRLPIDYYNKNPAANFMVRNKGNTCGCT